MNTVSGLWLQTSCEDNPAVYETTHLKYLLLVVVSLQKQRDGAAKGVCDTFFLIFLEHLFDIYCTGTLTSDSESHYFL